MVDEKTVSTLDVLADVEVATILEHLVDEHENVDSETVSEENLKEYNELPFHVVAKGESFFRYLKNITFICIILNDGMILSEPKFCVLEMLYI